MECESKSEFARRIGVSAGRVSQLIQRGLPVQDGRIPIGAALKWLDENLDHSKSATVRGGRGAAGTRPVRPPSADDGEPGDLIEAKRRHEIVKMDRTRVALENDRKKLVDRAEIGRAVFAFARAERDAWQGWAARLAPALAAELGTDARALAAALDREVARHLHELADAPMPEVLTHE